MAQITQPTKHLKMGQGASTSGPRSNMHQPTRPSPTHLRIPVQRLKMPLHQLLPTTGSPACQPFRRRPCIGAPPAAQPKSSHRRHLLQQPLTSPRCLCKLPPTPPAPAAPALSRRPVVTTAPLVRIRKNQVTRGYKEKLHPLSRSFPLFSSAAPLSRTQLSLGDWTSSSSPPELPSSSSASSSSSAASPSLGSSRTQKQQPASYSPSLSPLHPPAVRCPP